MKTILFGAGDYGTRYCGLRGSMEHIVAVADNFVRGSIMGHPIISPMDIKNYDYDKIVITLNDFDRKGNWQDEKIFAIYTITLQKTRLISSQKASFRTMKNS